MDEDELELVVVLHEIFNIIKIFLFFVCYYDQIVLRAPRRRPTLRLNRRYRMIDRVINQVEHMDALVNVSDTDCIEQLRMDRDTFCKLCFLLENVGGLPRSRNVLTSEKVAIFLSILGHHKKNRVVKFDFKRSGHTISMHFHHVLDAVIRLYNILLVTPQPVADDCEDERWKYFKGCLGALDGTYVQVRVPLSDKPRYRNRTGDISVNVLAVCDRNMNYTFILSGWEGSAADSRVLRDAVSRPNGLKVPNGEYYLCDGGYTNRPSFLAPYRGVRYHLDDWGSGSRSPQNHKELFNLRHAKARNIIERSFQLLKSRWAILRSNSFYPIKTHNKIIMACCLLHNFIRTTMPSDPLDNDVDQFVGENTGEQEDIDFVDQVEATPEWTNWRDELAMSMFNEWRH